MATTAKQELETPSKPDYGIDAPRDQRKLFVRGGLLLALGLGFFLMNQSTNPSGGLALFIVLGIIGVGFLAGGFVMRWSSTVGKIQLVETILDMIPCRGDEKVLDVGCGRGLFLIAAAKRLKSGRGTGIDIWDAEALSGNNADNARANARAEGVADKIKIDNGDARKLPYPAAGFDVVVSSLMLHHIKEPDGRSQALQEMVRTLKAGGHLAILDVFHTADYLKEVERVGLDVVQVSKTSFLWCVPTKWFVARKRG